MEAQYKLDCLQHDKQYNLIKFSGDYFDLANRFTIVMLNNYKKGESRISVFNLIKFLQICKKDIVVFIKEFEDQLKKENEE